MYAQGIKSFCIISTCEPRIYTNNHESCQQSKARKLKSKKFVKIRVNLWLLSNELRPGAKRGVNRVMRGGSWNNDAQNCRSAIRNNNPPDNRDNNVGFRLASSRQRPDAMCLRMHRLRQSPDHRPGPAPRCNRGQIRAARRLLVGRMARRLPPGSKTHIFW